jgi:GNAT superfamily N-acetyltransferase
MPVRPAAASASVAAVDRPQVVPLPPGRWQQAGDTLARAFDVDPIWAAVFPEPTRRATALSAMFRGLVRVHEYAGRPLSTVEISAVALWRPPGVRQRWWHTVQSRFTLPRVVAAFSADERRRLLGTLRQFEGRRHEIVPTPHWYLESLGVDPDRQGQGLGSLLVRHVLAQADTTSHPVYLETETPRTVAFYERLGFAVAEQHVARELDLPVWLMVRQPLSAQ